MLKWKLFYEVSKFLNFIKFGGFDLCNESFQFDNWIDEI